MPVRLLYPGLLMGIRGLPQIYVLFALSFGLMGPSTLALSADESIRPEVFVGTYISMDPLLEPTTDSGLSPGVREISIRVDKSTNTLYANVSRAENPDDEGKPFIPPLVQINLEPKVTEKKTAADCTIIEQSSKAEANRIVSVIDQTFKVGCWMRTSHKHTEITIQFGAKSEEIWIGVGKRADAPRARYHFRRLSVTPTCIQERSQPSPSWPGTSG